MEFNATFLITIVSFIVFAIIMNSILYEPIKKIVGERNKFYEENNKIVSKNEKEGEALVESKTAKLNSAREKSRDSIKQVQEKSKEEKENLLAFEKENLGKKVAENEENLNQEKENIKEEILKDAEEISDIIVSKITGGENA